MVNACPVKTLTHILTLVGVLGHGALMSFLLGRCPRERVTLDGAPDAEAPLLFVADIVQDLGET